MNKHVTYSSPKYMTVESICKSWNITNDGCLSCVEENLGSTLKRVESACEGGGTVDFQPTDQLISLLEKPSADAKCLELFHDYTIGVSLL